MLRKSLKVTTGKGFRHPKMGKLQKWDAPQTLLEKCYQKGFQNCYNEKQWKQHC